MNLSSRRWRDEAEKVTPLLPFRCRRKYRIRAHGDRSPLGQQGGSNGHTQRTHAPNLGHPEPPKEGEGHHSRIKKLYLHVMSNQSAAWPVGLARISWRLQGKRAGRELGTRPPANLFRTLVPQAKVPRRLRGYDDTGPQVISTMISQRDGVFQKRTVSWAAKIWLMSRRAASSCCALYCTFNCVCSVKR